MNYIYLACPYSHPDPAVREERFKAANKFAGVLMSAGIVVYSPISHSHPIALAHDLPTGWKFWGRIDEVFVHYCSAVFVLQLEGWDKSEGIKAELSLAAQYKKPILYIQDNLNV